MADPFSEFGGRPLPQDPFSEFGGKATPTAPGESPDNPLQEQGVTTNERLAIKFFGGNSKGILDWLQAKPGEGSKPAGFSYTGLDEDPAKQYEAKEYKPGQFAVRPVGTKEPWKVVDPDTGFFSKDIGRDILDVLPEIGSMVLPGGTAVKSAASMGALSGATKAIGNLYGFDASPMEVAKETAVGAGAGALGHALGKYAAPAVAKYGGKLLQAPAKAVNLVTRGEERAAAQAARDAVVGARGKLAEETLKAGEEAGKRASSLGSAIEAGGKEAEATAARAAAPGAKVPGAEEVAGALGKEPSDSTLRFLSNLVHPAYGVKAKHLEYVPEFVQLIQKHFGPTMRNRLGSEAMEQADKHLARWASERPQEEVSRTTLAYAQDIAKWMLGGEYKDILTAAEKQALVKMATGTAKEAEQGLARGALEKVIAKAMPEGVATAKQGLKEAAAKAAIARARVVRPAEGTLEKAGEVFRDQIGKVAGPLKNSEVGRIARTAGLAAALPLRVGAAAGRGLEWLAGPQAAAAVERANPSIRPLLRQALKRGPNAFRALIWSLAQRMPAVRRWLDSEMASAEGGD